MLPWLPWLPEPVEVLTQAVLAQAVHDWLIMVHVNPSAQLGHCGAVSGHLTQRLKMERAEKAVEALTVSQREAAECTASGAPYREARRRNAGNEMTWSEIEEKDEYVGTEMYEMARRERYAGQRRDMRTEKERLKIVQMLRQTSRRRQERERRDRGNVFRQRSEAG